jgi:hypothetical protein
MRCARGYQRIASSSCFWRRSNQHVSISTTKRDILRTCLCTRLHTPTPSRTAIHTYRHVYCGLCTQYNNLPPTQKTQRQTGKGTGRRGGKREKKEARARHAARKQEQEQEQEQDMQQARAANLVSKHKSQLHLHHAGQKPVTEISILGRM